MRKIPLLLAMYLALRPAAAPAAEFDLERWISRPGARLVVVEFYATWCGPCVESLPKWRALMDKHRADGLRLILVTTRDAKGCLSPPLSADEIVCDESGRIADLFGANPLPAAFVWNGQGKLLGKRLAASEVEQRLAGWLREVPRVAVNVTAGPQLLRDLLRSELRSSGKMEVVAGPEEQARLDKIKAESLKARYDEKSACEVGKELSANSILDARVGGDRLSLALFSAERGCLVASAIVPWNDKKPEGSAAEAVAALYGKLAPQVEMPFVASSAGTAPAQPPAVQNPSGAVILTQEPKLLVIRAEGNAPASAADRLERLNLGKRAAKNKAREAAQAALAAPPYSLDTQTAAGKIDAAEEEYSTTDSSVVVTLKVRL